MYLGSLCSMAQSLGSAQTESGVTKWVNGVRFFDYALRFRSE